MLSRQKLTELSTFQVLLGYKGLSGTYIDASLVSQSVNDEEGNVYKTDTRSLRSLSSGFKSMVRVWKSRISFEASYFQILRPQLII
jgi:hypothetical protein